MRVNQFSHFYGARSPPSIMKGATMERIFNVLFPRVSPESQRPLVDFGRVEDIPLFTIEELKKSVQSKKAPDPDGIPSETLKEIFSINPGLLLRMYNASLIERLFPTSSKNAKFVLISKRKGDPELPSSHRPLCMMETAGKWFETLIRSCLTSVLVAAGDLSPRQYGFRKWRPGIDVIIEVQRAVERAESHNHVSRRVLLVMLDVKNAFNYDMRNAFNAES